MTQEKLNEKIIQDFWTDYPMIFCTDGYDKKSSSPEDIFKHMDKMMRLKGSYFQKDGAPLLSKYIDYEKYKGKKILEIGFGTGWILNEFAKVKAKVYGIDLSKSHYKLSSYRFKDNPDVDLQVASAESIPFPDSSFDFVVAWGVLHHAADDIKCYEEVRRVLNPNGKAFLMLYRKGGPKYWWRKLFIKGIIGGGLRKYNWNVAKFIDSVTDVREEGDPGAPISRHYTRKELKNIFSNFSKVEISVSGNTGEWDNLPAHRFPLTNWLLPECIRKKLVHTFGAYWLIHLTV